VRYVLWAAGILIVCIIVVLAINPGARSADFGFSVGVIIGMAGPVWLGSAIVGLLAWAIVGFRQDRIRLFMRVWSGAAFIAILAGLIAWIFSLGFQAGRHFQG
jgi:hypothetical protein